MRIFVTGASGWIGSAVVPELLGAGHQVLGLARSDASAAAVTAAGADVLRGDLDDLDTLRAGAEASDGVIHLAFLHDLSQIEAAVRSETNAIETIGAALAGTGKPFVAASGTPAIPGAPGVPGQVATESDVIAVNSRSPMAGRAANARTLLGLADRGVRAAVVGLPRSVHGDGDRHGFVPRLIGLAREQGVSGYPGDGSSRWPAVHVLDAAHLFRLAIEQAPAGTRLHAVGDEGVPVRDIAAAIGRHLDVPAETRPAEDFGFLGLLLSIDQPASATLTRELLGWQPVQPGLLADIEKGHYFG